MIDKEAVYDAEINPLMAQIIAICKRAGIACLCTFDLDDDLGCTTCLPNGDGVFPESIRRAQDVIISHGSLFDFTVMPTSSSQYPEIDDARTA